MSWHGECLALGLDSRTNSVGVLCSIRSSSSSAAPKIQQLTPAAGAVIHGLDLANVSQHRDSAELIYPELLKHGVVFLKHQGHVNDDDIVKFAQQFGNLEGPHPLYSPDPTSPLAVVAHDENNVPDGAEWHSDCTWSPNPPFASVLWPKILPTCGGDTLWANTARAFETLDEKMKDDLRKLDAIHDLGTFRNNYVKKVRSPSTPVEEQRLQAAAAIAKGFGEFGCAIHPVVKRHPVSGAECLFVNEAFTSHIVGLMASESRNLLSFLFTHMHSPGLQCRWKWDLGDVALWDNRSTIHYASADYAGQRRRMHRVTILNDTMG